MLTGSMCLFFCCCGRCLLVRCQAAATEGDICAMGGRLAIEVSKYIQEKIVEEGLQLQNLSFVGFSMG